MESGESSFHVYQRATILQLQINKLKQLNYCYFCKNDKGEVVFWLSSACRNIVLFLIDM
jgi:hypothetical protein